MLRLDLRNSITPFAILRIGDAMRNLSPGESLEILCDDDAVMDDLKRIHHDCTLSSLMEGMPRHHKPCSFRLTKKTETKE